LLAWYPAQISSGADNPAVGDQAVPAGHTGAHTPRGMTC